MKRRMIFTLTLTLVLLATPAQTRAVATLSGAALWRRGDKVASAEVQRSSSIQNAAVYYVDNETGDDTNPGTEGLPWAHCPGMYGWSGRQTLEPGDTVYFKNTGTWTASSAEGERVAMLQVVGGVTYDGRTWGPGTRAILRPTSGFFRNIINFMEDHPSIATIVRGFELDANNQIASGVSMNEPEANKNLDGAVKRVEDCVIHDVYSSQIDGSWKYGIIVSGGAHWQYGPLHIHNVEIVNCTVYNISRTGITLYGVNSYPETSYGRNILIRGCEVYNTGLDIGHTAGNGIGVKNHHIDVTIEFNYIHHCTGHGISIESIRADGDYPEAGTEQGVIRYNIITSNKNGNFGASGIRFYGNGPRDLHVYGNIIADNDDSGFLFALSEAQDLACRIYNNTLYKNGQGASHPWQADEVIFNVNPYTFSILEFRNNVFYADSEFYCYYDANSIGKATAHTNNIYYREGQGNLVRNGTSHYDAANLALWESSAYATQPAFENPSNLPGGFSGTYGLDLVPDTDGLSIKTGVGVDNGADLGAFNGAINLSGCGALTRPQGAGWDIGAYEFVPQLVLQGTPADRAIHLSWTVNVTLPVTATWQIDYTSQTGSAYLPLTGIISPTRAYTLTGLTNGVWYTVTLSAMQGSAAILTDTVRVMPTDRFVYLPLVCK